MLPARAASKPAGEEQVCVCTESLSSQSGTGLGLLLASLRTCNLCEGRRCANHKHTTHFQPKGLASSMPAQASSGPCKRSLAPYVRPAAEHSPKRHQFPRLLCSIHSPGNVRITQTVSL